MVLCLLTLSVGATFAADNASDVIAIDDEITIEEPLAADQDAQVVSANDTSSETVYITNSNINQYIGESGQIYENVTADEFIFNDTFDKLKLSVERPITLTGGIFNNPNFEIYSSNVVLQNFTIVQDNGVNSIFVAGEEDNHTANVTVQNMDITFIDDQSGADAIPIHVLYSDNFMLVDSDIAYSGKTNGTYLSNAIRVTNSRNAIISNNKIFADLASVTVDWIEVPAGSGNFVSNPVSEGIVVKDCEGAIFDSNVVVISLDNVSGDYDTIYAVDILGSDAVITNNNITAEGNSYIYGIILSVCNQS